MSEPTQVVGVAVFHPERLVAVLGRFKVKYVLAGTLAARLQGFPWIAAIAEIVPAIEPENFEALSRALAYLGARPRTSMPGTSFEPNADTLASADSWQFNTTCGRLDVTFRPGAHGYTSLAERAVRFDVHGDTVLAAHLDDLVTVARGTGTALAHPELGLLSAVAERYRR